MAVAEGDSVKAGQLLFEDRKSDGVRFTAPVEGTVVAINRGERRALQSLVLELKVPGQQGEQVTFEAYAGADVEQIDRAAATDLIAESGLWTAFGLVPMDAYHPRATDRPRSLLPLLTPTRLRVRSMLRSLGANRTFRLVKPPSRS